MEGKAGDLMLAQFALLSLSYVTKDTLADDAKAVRFYADLIDRTKFNAKPTPTDIPALVSFARLGELELEQQIKLLQAEQPQASPY